MATDIRNEFGVFQSILRILQPITLFKFINKKELDDEKMYNIKSNYLAGVGENNNILNMQNQIKEYSTIKHIMDRNADVIRVSDDSPKVKSVDCQVMFTMIQDAVRYRTVLKVQDDHYIFVRRAMSVMAYNQSEKKKNKEFLDSDAHLVDHNHLSVQ